MIIFSLAHPYSGEEMIKFITGTTKNPLVGRFQSIEIEFKHDCPDKCGCYPTSMLCGGMLKIPLHWTSESMAEAIKNCKGVARITDTVAVAEEVP